MKALWLALLIFPIYSFCQSTGDFVDGISQASLQITGRRGIRPLWSATGFVMKVRGQLYLITNNHVAGEEYAQNEHLKNFGRRISKDSIPDNFMVRCFTDIFNRYSTSEIRIRKKSGEFLGIKFFDNEKDTSTILDVVALPVMEAELHAQLRWVDSTSLNTLLPLYPGMDLFVVGYPSDSGRINSLPIWKRGTIASEPNLITLGYSWFWIDATTRGGMSGSPVVARGNFVVNKNGGIMAMTSSAGIPTFFVGIYSAQSYNLELGFVTRIDKIYSKLRDMTP